MLNSIKDMTNDKFIIDDIVNKQSFNYIKDNKIKIASVEGNIGAGKSSALDHIKSKGYFVIEEGIEIWGKLLEKTYNDPKKWRFHLQVSIINTMYNKIDLAIQEKNIKDDIIFMDRSMMSWYFFTEIAYENKEITHDEFVTLSKLYGILNRPADYYIYLDIPVDVCFQRMKKRDREFEKHITDFNLHQSLDIKFKNSITRDAEKYKNSLLSYDRFYILRYKKDLTPEDISNKILHLIFEASKLL